VPQRLHLSSRNTLRTWIASAARRFDAAQLAFGHGAQNADEEAVWLLAHVMRIPFSQVDASLECVLNKVERAKARRLIELRVRQRKPLAYLLGEAWLVGHRFYVDERVIVPRSFIAELLGDRLVPWIRPGVRVRRVLDMCTGSGCLAILSALEFTGATVDAVDVSAAALAVAHRNVRDYGLEQRIRLIRSDLFQDLAQRSYDLILANPPYVAARAMKRLPAEYRHEPELALAGGRDGLAMVNTLLKEAPRFLAPRGMLVIESGRHRRALEARFPRLPFTWITTSAGEGTVFALRRDQLCVSEASNRRSH
jgi:ribosomal protein L3 glutamine methyltransferase